jgi:hypothetical protein
MRGDEVSDAATRRGYSGRNSRELYSGVRKERKSRQEEEEGRANTVVHKHATSSS